MFYFFFSTKMPPISSLSRFRFKKTVWPKFVNLFPTTRDIISEEKKNFSLFYMQLLLGLMNTKLHTIFFSTVLFLCDKQCIHVAGMFVVFAHFSPLFTTFSFCKLWLHASMKWTYFCLLPPIKLVFAYFSIFM